MVNRWRHSSDTRFDVGYFFAWCTKYKRALFDDEKLRDFLESTLREKADRIDISIHQITINPSDIQLRVSSSPSDSPHHIVQQFKAHSYRYMVEKFPTLKSRVPTIWTRHYYCATLGKLDLKKVSEFLSEQEKK